MGSIKSSKVNDVKLILKRLNTKIYLGVLLLVFSISLSTSHNIKQIDAATPTPTPTPTAVPPSSAPTFEIFQAFGYRNILQTGDFFILIRYELPESVGGAANTAWCVEDYLRYPAGCELTPPAPSFPESLKAGYMSFKYYDYNGLVQADQPKVPRIGGGLAGIYNPAPAADWGWDTQNTAQVCLESSSFYFQNPYADCTIVILKESTVPSNASYTGGQLALGTELGGSNGILYNLESQLNLPINTLVSGVGQVTPFGQRYAEESLKGITFVAVDGSDTAVFQLGTESVYGNQGFQRESGESKLQTQIDLEAANSGATQSFKIAADEYMGLDGTLLAALIFGFAAIMLGATVMATTKSAPFSLGSAALVMTSSIFVRGVSVGFLFTGLSILIVLGSYYWIRKQPE